MTGREAAELATEFIQSKARFHQRQHPWKDSIPSASPVAAHMQQPRNDSARDYSGCKHDMGEGISCTVGICYICHLLSIQQV